MIHTLTLNPAIDRILYLNHFEKNVTNRIRNSLDTIGGKGTHVSINLALLGAQNTAWGICHGDNGLRVIDMLKDYNINIRFNHYDKNGKETRTNYLLIEGSGDCTIAAECGVTLKEHELSELLTTMGEIITPGDYLVFSGDASNSPDSSIYNKILHALKAKNLKVFIDTSGQSLEDCLRESPYMIKPNLDELSTLVGYSIPNEDHSIVTAIHSLDSFNIPIIAVSLGGDGSIVKTSDSIYRVYPPKVHAINTIGCGDSFLAGFIYGLSKDINMEEILRIATAISAATAESTLSVGYSSDRMNALKDAVRIEKIY